jgi:hypothetical protein
LGVVAHTRPMPRIQPDHIVAAQRRIEPLSLEQGEALADAIFASQPNLLASILVLSRFGVSNQDLDVALRILFICHEAVRATGFVLPEIGEADLELCLARVAGRGKFIEGLSKDSAVQAVADHVHEHAEPHLLAVVYDLLHKHDLTSVRTEAEQYLVLAVLNLVESISNALTD